MPRLNIDLSTDEFDYINEEVTATTCKSASELISRALKDYRRARALEELDRLVDEGIKSGDSIEVTPEYWERKRQQFLERHRAAGQ